MFKSHIKLIVLKHLSKEKMSGYDLIKSLGESGANQPSPGYIYPLLNNLQKKKFVSVKKDGRRKIYSITEKGKKLLENLENKKREMMNVMAGVADKREIERFAKLKSDIYNNSSVQNRKTIQSIHNLILSISKSKNEEKKEKMRKVLDETIKKLKKIRG